jgi:HSP20 family protein
MLTRWNDWGRFGSREFASTFDNLDELRREMNRLLFDFERGLPDTDAATAVLWPRATLEDTGAALVFRAEVPGLADKDIELTVDENTLRLKGERTDKVPEGYSVHRKERSAYRFSRSFALPAKVDAENVQAALKHGVLTVTLPKAKEAQPRQINVKSA